MYTTPAPPETASVTSSIWSALGEANTSPIAAPSSRPWPTYPRKTGRWPDPPPLTTATLSGLGDAARTIPREPTRRSSVPWAATMPSSISSTKRSGSLRIFCTRADLLQRLDGGDERGETLFRVGEEHPGLVVRVELVVDAGVALAHRSLDDDDRFRVVDVEDRHPRDGRPGSARRRVRDIVRADDEGDVRPLELGVDVVHLLELGIRDVRLGEQDVHVAGHPTSDGMDRVLHVHATILEQLGELANGVLG